MIRLYEQHQKRFQKELEGYWDFTTIEGAVSETLPITYPHKLFVPGCWESNISFNHYRGKAAYRRTIHLDQASHLRLVFKGVSHTGDVYLDGQHIAHHYNAYTQFSVVVPKVSAGEHEVVVKVNNAFDETSALHIPNDYYTYGGLIRPVVMELVSDVYIQNVQFTPVFEKGKWQAKVIFTLENVTSEAQKIVLRHLLEDQVLISTDEENELKVYEIGARSQLQVHKTFEFDNIRSWSTEAPNLCLFGTQLYKQDEEILMDDFIERVGFRTIEVCGNQLLLNQQPIFLQGFNRHEDFNIAGCAIPMQLASVDMDYMLDLACNSVRTSHYPNDERFLDMCDERGILVWEENHARGLTLESMQHPLFDQQCADCIDEMITDHYNHPAIVIWGILNECASNTVGGREKYEKQFAQIKSLDRSRLVTFASCHPFTELCLDLVDIVSFNSYHAWYGEDRTVEEIEASYMKIRGFIEGAGGSGKPLIISEFGAGAVYGHRAPHLPKGSEERQAEILERSLTVYQNRPEIVGTYIWQFCDCRVTEERWGVMRPRGLNDKGIVDEFRRPKLAYQTVKAFHEKKKKERAHEAN